MKPMCSKPLIQGVCCDGVTEYRVFATDGFPRHHTLIGAIKYHDGWQESYWDEKGFWGVVADNCFDIPPADLVPLLSGVIEAKENR